MAAAKKRMLVPTERLFFWAKRDRAVVREPSFFRTRSQGWRDLVPPVEDDSSPRFRFRRMAAQRKQPARPIWTPWLWVK
jgi:hypothetical protein